MNQEMEGLRKDMEALERAEELALKEHEKAKKWAQCHNELNVHYNKTKKELTLQIFKIEDAEPQTKEVKKELEVALKKAKEEAQSIKELQETNKVLLEKYYQNEKLLQRFLSCTPALAPPPPPSTRKVELQIQINRL